MKETYKLILIISSILLLSFILHSSLFFIFDNSKYNLYDTDSWYSIREVHKLSNNENIHYENMINYPLGRSITWGSLLPFILSIFIISSDNPLTIFNKLAFYPPILSLIFSLVIYLIISKLFNTKTALYSLLLISIGSGVFLQNCTYGIIDHHLLEAVLGTLLILLMLLFLKAKKLLLIPIISIIFISLFYTSFSYFFYLGIIFLIIFVWVLYFLYNYNKLLFYLLTPLLFLVLFLSSLLIQNSFIFNLLNWAEPIEEIQPLSPFIFLYIFNFLIFVLIYGAYKDYRSSFSLNSIILNLIVIFLSLLTLKFMRIQTLLYPFICILSAYYLQKYFDKPTAKMLISLFLLISALSSLGLTITLFSISSYNNDWNDNLLYLSSEPENKIVLSWWDYGNWVLAISNKPIISGAFQDNIYLTSKIFTSDYNTSLSLIKNNNISYISLSKFDNEKYDYMLFYSNSQLPYSASYLNNLISKNIINETLIFENNNTLLYKI